MKVVQQGVLTKSVTCKRCKSTLEYEPEDVKSTTYTDGDTISDIKYHLQCPLCLQKLGPSRCFVYVASPSVESPRVKAVSSGTKFNLSIDLFTRDVRDSSDVAQALRDVADRLAKFTSQPWSPYALTGTIYAKGTKRAIVRLAPGSKPIDLFGAPA